MHEEMNHECNEKTLYPRNLNTKTKYILFLFEDNKQKDKRSITTDCILIITERAFEGYSTIIRVSLHDFTAGD